VLDGQCCFCGSDDDSVAHVVSCAAVMSVYDDLGARTGACPLANGRAALMLQTDMGGASLAGVVAFFATVWNIRAMTKRGVSLGTYSQLVALVWHCLECLWLVRCCPSRSRKERRADRVREPAAAPNRVIYYSDGASRGHGQTSDSMASWGAAVWPATLEGYGAGRPVATARGWLGFNASNNVAEYHGLKVCMRRAVQRLDPSVLFEVDSMLLSRQLARRRPWACRCEDLLDVHRGCVDLGMLLEARGVEWDIRHVYREFNQVGDSLANRAIDEGGGDIVDSDW